MFTVVEQDNHAVVPTEWTDAAIRSLWDHARDLGHNGNPAGFLLTGEWSRWVSIKRNGEHILKRRDKWNYAAIRAWIAANPERAQRVYQLRVRSVY